MPRYFVQASTKQRADRAHDRHYERLAEKRRNSFENQKVYSGEAVKEELNDGNRTPEGLHQTSLR